MNSATIKLSEGLRGLTERVEKDIEETAGERIGFSLIIFTEGRASYSSNCERKQVVEQLEYLLELWKSGMPDIKAHGING